MKKIHILSIAGLCALMGTGCLGSMKEDVVGTWRTEPVNPMANTVEMTVSDDGMVVVTDLVTLATDTGEWTMEPNIENNRLIISGIDIYEFQTQWNAEWHILQLDATRLIIAAKGNEFGGVFQQDLTRQ